MAKKVKGWICKSRGGIVEIWATKYPPIKCRDNGRSNWFWAINNREEGYPTPMEIYDDIYPSISCDDKPKRVEISITIKEKAKRKTPADGLMPNADSCRSFSPK